jgi:hypothetical protein
MGLRSPIIRVGNYSGLLAERPFHVQRKQGSNGVGASIAAKKVSGVRAGLIHEDFPAARVSKMTIGTCCVWAER